MKGLVIYIVSAPTCEPCISTYPGTCFPSARTFLSVNPGLQKLVWRDSYRLFYSFPELMWELSLTNLIRIDEHGDIFFKCSINLQIHGLTISTEKLLCFRIKKKSALCQPYPLSDSSIQRACKFCTNWHCYSHVSKNKQWSCWGLFLWEKGCTLLFLYGNNYQRKSGIPQLIWPLF